MIEEKNITKKDSGKKIIIPEKKSGRKRKKIFEMLISRGRITTAAAGVSLKVRMRYTDDGRQLMVLEREMETGIADGTYPWIRHTNFHYHRYFITTPHFITNPVK